ncbi:MAG: AraC family transcriptional regulator [Anaerolineales bacterium]|nr:AraC family transcriptional regulator [Anaerolineales bacterium]
MLNLEPMSTAVTFIENHLQENIKVADMADAAGYSLFHFCRTFNKIVHHSPYDYLIRRRLSESARLLLETDQRITDIAFIFQFNSLETYSRAFKRLFHQLPSEWKKENSQHAYRIMPRLTSSHLAQRNQPDFILHKPTQRKALSLVGLMSWIDGDEQAALSQLWAKLAAKLNSPPPKMGYGLRWLSENTILSAHFYMAGVETGPDDTLVMKTVPAGLYGRFQSTTSPSDRQHLLDYIIHTWLPQSNLMLTHPFILEHYQICPARENPSHCDLLVPVQSES